MRHRLVILVVVAFPAVGPEGIAFQVEDRTPPEVLAYPAQASIDRHSFVLPESSFHDLLTRTLRCGRAGAGSGRAFRIVHRVYQGARAVGSLTIWCSPYCDELARITV